MTVGSNSTVAAPIAVKCSVQIAAVSKPTASDVEPFTLKAHIAAVANTTPAATEAITSIGSHRMYPAMLIALIPE